MIIVTESSGAQINDNIYELLELRLLCLKLVVAEIEPTIVSHEATTLTVEQTTKELHKFKKTKNHVKRPPTGFSQLAANIECRKDKSA